MAEEAGTGVSSRAERKALEKAKILQRESQREIFRLVRRENGTFRAASAKLAGYNSSILTYNVCRLSESESNVCR